MSDPAAFLITNGRVLAADGLRPPGAAILVRDGRITDLGAASRLRSAGDLPELDVGGRVILPGFIDAHIHLLSYAASLVSVDCGPAAVASIADIQEAIAERAAAVDPGAWIRAVGYDELALREQRHPTRHDLDKAASANPVRLLHRTGHAVVLNSRALDAAGIDSRTPEPAGGYMERDLVSGEPTGLLVEMNDIVDPVVPPLAPAELRAALVEANRRLLAFGVTCIEDATPTNGLVEWRLFEQLFRDDVVTVGVSLMEGWSHRGEMPASALGGRLRRGAVKIAPRELQDGIGISQAELSGRVAEVDSLGRRVAVHAVGRPAVEAAVAALEALPASRSARRHRVEHAGLCSPALAQRLAAAGATVVTQPGFLFWNGDLYARRIVSSEWDDLYALRRLIDSGVAVAGSSDAPVAPPDVIAALRAAVERQSRAGGLLAANQAIDRRQALDLFTTAAALAVGVENERGAIRPGLAADLVLLNDDLTRPDVDWLSLRVEATIVAGRLAYVQSPGQLAFSRCRPADFRDQ